MHIILTIIIVVAIALLIWYLYRKYILEEGSIIHLPLQELGYHNVPAFPFQITEVAKTLVNLNYRNKEVQQAKFGLSAEYTIQGKTANAYSFAYDSDSYDQRQKAISELQKNIDISSVLHFKNPTLVQKKLKQNPSLNTTKSKTALTTLSLDDPKQFSLSWTTYGNVLRDASKELLDKWSKSLTDADEATKQFFPNIAKYGGAYNLLLLQKVNDSNIKAYKIAFDKYWTAEMETLFKAGHLYIIDLTIYKNVKAQNVDGFDRFTPATFTWLKQDFTTKAITPFAVYVSGFEGKDEQFYDIKVATPSTWLYALQAAKVSVTVYGIWYGHVYHWHVVTATMVMTMFNSTPENHALYQLLAPQSQYIIGFNDTLLLLWKEAAPPTSIATGEQFLELLDIFAKDRLFFDDDPTTTIEKLGLSEAHFTIKEPWDQYPIVGYLLKIWEITKAYVEVFVDTSFPNESSIQSDTHLQHWIKVSGETDEGNIKGLPEMKTPEDLKRVLTSLLYRINAHGISRMDNTANPALTFVSNFPPCLQHTLIPEPSSTFDTKGLLKYLPTTGTIGQMITFYFTFIYSAPYESLIPLKGVTDNLFFTGGENDARNIALIKLRTDMAAFMNAYTDDNSIPNIPKSEAQIHQWPLHVET